MRAIVYLAGLVALVPIILVRPWIGILAWNFLGLLNPQGFTWGWAERIPYALLVGGSTLLGLVMTNQRKSIPACKQTVVLGMLVAWFTLTTVFAWPPDTWAQWNKVMKIMLMTLAAIVLVFNPVRTRMFILALAVALGLLGVKGGLFTILSGGQYRVLGPGGFLAGNTEIGLALAMILPVLAVIAREQQRRWAKWGVWSAFALTILATVFTYSRGALLGLAAVMALMFLRLTLKAKAIIVAAMIPLMIAAIPLIPENLINRAATIQTYEQDRSAMGRIQAWGVAFNVARTRITGGGFNLERIDPAQWLSYARFTDINDYKTIAAHSIYFQMLGDHGFIGLALFLALLASTWHGFGVARRQARDSPEFAWLGEYAWALRVGLVGYAVSGAFLSLAYFDLLYAFVALSVIMQRELRPGEASVVAGRPGAVPTPSPAVADTAASAFAARARSA